MGLFTKVQGERRAVSSMAVGVTLWLIHYIAGWKTFLSPWLEPRGVSIPVSLSVITCGFIAYLGFGPRDEKLKIPDTAQLRYHVSWFNTKDP
jgi:hypothetical protein